MPGPPPDRGRRGPRRGPSLRPRLRNQSASRGTGLRAQETRQPSRSPRTSRRRLRLHRHGEIERLAAKGDADKARHGRDLVDQLLQRRPESARCSGSRASSGSGALPRAAVALVKPCPSGFRDAHRRSRRLPCSRRVGADRKLPDE